MEKYEEIANKVKNGEISAELAKQQVLDLFVVNKSSMTKLEINIVEAIIMMLDLSISQ